MLSKIPIELKNLKTEDVDKEILRTAIIAELDAANLYEQLSEMTPNEIIKKVFLDIAKEEKTHIGEFQALLLEEDKEQEKELKNGKEEVEKIKKSA
jgi:rubrerythrin